MAWHDDPEVRKWESTQFEKTSDNPYNFVNEAWKNSSAFDKIFTANLDKRNFPIRIEPETSRSWYAKLLARKERIEGDAQFQNLKQQKQAAAARMCAEESAQKLLQEARERQISLQERAARAREEEHKKQLYYQNLIEKSRQAKYLTDMAAERYEDVEPLPHNFSGNLHLGDGEALYASELALWKHNEKAWRAQKEAHLAATARTGSCMPRFDYGFK